MMHTAFHYICFVWVHEASHPQRSVQTCLFWQHVHGGLQFPNLHPHKASFLIEDLESAIIAVQIGVESDWEVLSPIFYIWQICTFGQHTIEYALENIMNDLIALKSILPKFVIWVLVIEFDIVYAKCMAMFFWANYWWCGHLVR